MKSVLLIDKDPIDSGQITRYFTSGDVQVGITHISSLDEVEDYLKKHAHGPAFRLNLPSLIILDVEFPDTIQGLEILKQINNIRHFADIPVFIFTNNFNKNTVANCYVRGANGYFLKPKEHINFLGAIKALSERWQTIIQRGFGYNYKAV